MKIIDFEMMTYENGGILYLGDYFHIKSSLAAIQIAPLSSYCQNLFQKLSKRSLNFSKNLLINF